MTMEAHDARLKLRKTSTSSINHCTVMSPKPARPAIVQRRQRFLVARRACFRCFHDTTLLAVERRRLSFLVGSLGGLGARAARLALCFGYAATALCAVARVACAGVRHACVQCSIPSRRTDF